MCEAIAAVALRMSCSWCHREKHPSHHCRGRLEGTATNCTVQVFSAIAGRSRLPWEVGSPGNLEERLKPLRGLRVTILQCLSRDPSQRPSAARLLSSWDSSFDHVCKSTPSEDSHYLPQPRSARTSLKGSAVGSCNMSPAGSPVPPPSAHGTAQRHASHWRMHTAAGSSSGNPDLSRIGSMLQSVQSASQAASLQSPAKLSPGTSSHAQSPLGCSGPSSVAQGASSAAPSMTSQVGSRGSPHMPLHMGAFQPQTGSLSDQRSAGTPCAVPSLPLSSPQHESGVYTTDRITSTGQLTTDGGTTERPL
jgi:hypothetical protein